MREVPRHTGAATSLDMVLATLTKPTPNNPRRNHNTCNSRDPGADGAAGGWQVKEVFFEQVMMPMKPDVAAPTAGQGVNAKDTQAFDPCLSPSQPASQPPQ